MTINNGLKVGQVVKSKAGRDKGRVFIVYKILDENYVLIVDGDLRRLDKPKKKKIKHLIVYNKVLPEIEYRLSNNFNINNAYVRKILEPYKDKR